MIFKPARLVSLISRDLTLGPGDVIACGTSVGAGKMKPGSRIEVVIDGIGMLFQPFRGLASGRTEGETGPGRIGQMLKGGPPEPAKARAHGYRTARFSSLTYSELEELNLRAKQQRKDR